MDKYIWIGLLISVPWQIFRIFMYLKYKRNVKLFNGLNLFAIILGIIYGFRGDH